MLLARSVTRWHTMSEFIKHLAIFSDLVNWAVHGGHCYHAAVRGSTRVGINIYSYGAHRVVGFHSPRSICC